jgi:hypothetical protein
LSEVLGRISLHEESSMVSARDMNDDQVVHKASNSTGQESADYSPNPPNLSLTPCTPQTDVA